MYKFRNFYKINKRRMTAFIVMLTMVAGIMPSGVLAVGESAGDDTAADNNGIISQTEDSVTYGPGLYTLSEDGSLELVDDLDEEEAEAPEANAAPSAAAVPEEPVDLSDRIPVSYDYEGRIASESIELGEYTEEKEAEEEAKLEEEKTIQYQPGFQPFDYTQRPLSSASGVVTLEKTIPGQDYYGTVTKTSGYYRAYSDVTTEGSNSRTFIFNGINITCTDTSANCVLLLETANKNSLLNVAFAGENYITKYGSGSITSIIRATGGGKVYITINNGSLTISVSGATNNYFIYNNPSSKCQVCRFIYATTGVNVWREWYAPLDSAPYDPNPNSKVLTAPCYGLTAMYDINIYRLDIRTKETFTEDDMMYDEDDYDHENGRIRLTVGDTVDLTGDVISNVDPERYVYWGNDGITYKISDTVEQSRASITSNQYDGVLTAKAPGNVSVCANPNAQLGMDAADNKSVAESTPINFVIGQALAPKKVAVERLSETSAKFSWDEAFVDYGTNDTSEIKGYDIYMAKEPITDENINDPDIVEVIPVTSSEVKGEYTFEDLETDATYYFRIRTHSELFGSSGLSAEVSKHLYIDPTPVTEVTAARVDDVTMDIAWSGAGGTNIIGYKIYYSNGELPTNLSVCKEIYLKEEYDRLAAIAEAKGQTFNPGSVPYADEYWDYGSGKLRIVDPAIAPQNTYYIKVETITRPVPTEESFLLSSGLSEAYGEVYMFKSPEPPKFIQAERENNNTAHVIWKDAQGDSLYGYRVYYFLFENLEIPFDNVLDGYNNGQPDEGIIMPSSESEFELVDLGSDVFEVPSQMEETPVAAISQKDSDIDKIIANGTNYAAGDDISKEGFIDISQYVGSSDVTSGNVDEEYVDEYLAKTNDGFSMFTIDEDATDPTKLKSPLETNNYSTSYTGEWISSSSERTWMELATAGNYYFNGVTIRGNGSTYNGTILFRNKGTANLHFYGTNTISRTGFSGEKASAIYVTGGATVNIYNYGTLILYSDGQYAIYDNEGTVNLRANKVSTDQAFYGTVTDNTTAPPTAPETITAAKSSATSATVSWTNADGGSYQISGYRIYYSNKGEPTRNSDYVSFKLTDPKAQMLSNGTGSYTIEGLVPLSTYKFKIVTVTEAASSAMSTAFGETELTVNVTPPTTVTAKKANATSAYIEWSNASLDAGDGKIVGYKIYYSNTGEVTEQSPWEYVNSDNKSGGNTVIKGLTTSTQYTFKVMTISQYKPSELSESSNPADLTIHITPPAVIEATREDTTSVRIDWRDIELEEGIIDSYRVYYSQGSEPTESTTTYVDVVTSADAAMTIIENLSPGSEYYFKVKAFSTYRNSELSATAYINLSINSFAPKQILAERIDERSAMITWEGATASGGSITSYKIYYDTEIPTHLSPYKTVSGDDTGVGSATISGLTSGEVYFFRVQTVSSIGESSLSSIYASAFLYKGVGIQDDTVTSVQSGSTYVIESNGEYYLEGTEEVIYNAAVNVNDGVEATIYIPNDFVIDNSGSCDYSQSAIALGENSKVTIRIDSQAAFYGSPASDGTTNELNGKGGNGGYAAINVPESATLIIKGNGELRAYGGDAGDGGNSIRNNDIGGSGGGGAGAGIGGNGGAGGNANTSEDFYNAENGHDGQNSGYIHIVGKINVYAYGGAGGSGGYVINGDAGGGGGYPAAGIGGGGAGGGGGTTEYGGGGFSGGAGENGLATGASMIDGAGCMLHNNDGGGYFSAYAANRLGGGAAGSGGTTGGAGGTAGTMFAETTVGRVYAYNGNYVTSLDSGVLGNDWGENPTPIYAQLGYNISTIRGAGISEIFGSVKSVNAVKLMLEGTINQEYSYNNIVGIGSGAGYVETSNGVYAPYVFNKNNNIFGEDYVTDLDSMSKWSFRVQTSSANGLSRISEAMDSTYLYTTPNPPTLLEAEWYSPTAVKLTWSGVTGAAIDRYYIYYTTTPNELITRWNVTNAVEYIDTDMGVPSPVSENDIYVGADTLVMYNAVRGQQYKILDAEGNDAKGQVWCRLSEKSATTTMEFIGLEPDTKYMIITRYEHADGGAPSDNSEPLTFVTRSMPLEEEEDPDATPAPTAEAEEQKNPLDRSKWTHDPVTESSVTVTTKSITIDPAYYGSEYRLLDESGKPVTVIGSDNTGIYLSDWKTPDDNKIVYSGLTEDTTYTISVRYRSMGGFNASAISASLPIRTLAVDPAPEEEEDPEEAAEGVVVEPIRLSSFDGEAIVKGLTSNNTYYFKMAAGSIYQDKSDISSAMAYTYLYNVPTTPEIYDLIPLNNGIRLHQIRTEDNKGSRIQKYRVYYYIDDDETEYQVEEFVVDENAEDDLKLDDIEIHGLTNAKTYTVYVTAVNSAGESKASNKLSVTAGTPWAPDPFRVHSGEDRSLNLKYSAYEPTVDNGYPVDHYNIYKDGEFLTETTDLTYMFTGRFYGDTHVFEVSGVNEFGEGPKTDAVSRSIGSPSTAQVETIAYYSDGSDFEPIDFETKKTGIDVSWKPANGNGEVINTYTVYLSERGEPKEIAFEIHVDPDTKLIETDLHIPAFIMQGDEKITYLKYGQQYNIEIEATSIAGTGSRSEPYYFTYGAPSAPIIMQADGSDEIITTTFISTEGNGADVIGFRLYLDGELYMPEGCDADGTVVGPPIVIDKLANGVTYTLEVTAVNEFGESAKSAPKTAVPGRQPSEPRNVKAEPLSGTEVALSWEPPVNNGGYAVKSYEVVGYQVGMETPDDFDSNQDAVSHIKCTVDVDVENCTALVSGLTKGTKYEFRVFAVNDLYTGYIGLSNEVETLNTPDPPTITKIEAGASKALNQPITIWWDPPTVDGGSPVERYDLYAYDTANDEYHKINATPIGDTVYTIRPSDNEDYTYRGSTYQFAVVAKNAIGDSDKSDKVSVLVGVPYAPIITEAETEGNSIHLKWKMPDMECYVEDYSVYVDDKTQSKVRINDAKHMYCDLNNLEWGKTVTIWVRAFNDIGCSEFSQPVKVTVGTSLPPTITSIVNGFEQVTLSWIEPEETSSIEKYNVYAECDGNRFLVEEENLERVSNTQAVVKGLTGGKQYTFVVTAYCKIEQPGKDPIYTDSLDSNSVMATPWTYPDAPVIDPYSIIAGEGEFTFEVERPNMYGLDFAGYKVYLDGVPVTEEYCTINDNKITVKGVENGLPDSNKSYGHDFSILAVGRSPLDNVTEYDGIEATAQVTTGLPQKATIDDVIPGNHEITIRYAVPNAERVNVTHYDITYTVLGIEQTVRVTDKTYTITGLTNGVPCDITVRGVNAWGEGPYSDTVTAIAGTPESPEFTKAMAGDAIATLEWTIPSTPLNTTIYKYNIYINGELAYESNKNSMIVTNLTNGEEYNFQVAAVNDYGVGALSKTAKVVPGKVPGAVAGATLKAISDTEVEIDWLDPVDDGGHGVEAYIVKHINGSTENITVDSENKHAVVSGLEPGTWYNFIIIGTNEVGDGEEYYTDSVRTMIAPSAPTLEKVSSVNHNISARWQPSADEGGTPVTGYNLYISDDKDSDGVKVNTDPIVGTTFTYEYDMDNGTPPIEIISGTVYYIKVSAINAIGEGELSKTMETTGVGNLAPSAPGRPRDISAEAGDSRVLVRWTNPAYDGNDEITDYYIYAGESTDSLAYRGKVDGTTYTFMVNNLNNGTNYVFAVRAINSKGQSDLSNYVWAIPTKINIPQQPTGLAYYNDTKKENMTITWNAVAGEGITYRVYVDGVCYETDDPTYTLPVASGKKYSIQVSAVNEAGETISQYIYARNNLNVMTAENELTRLDADYDGEIDEKVEYSVPYAPEVSYEYANRVVQLHWSTPFDGNNTIRSYEIYVNGLCRATFNVDEDGNPKDTTGKLVVDEDGNYTLTEKDDVIFNEAFSIQIAAVNGYGSGDKSDAMLMYLTQREFPSEVKAYQADSKNDPNTVTVQWRVPDNVEEASGYVIYINGAGSKIYETDSLDNDGYVYNRDTGICTYCYRGATVNSYYIFRVSTLYIDMTESRISAAGRTFVEQYKPEPPEWDEDNPITFNDGTEQDSVTIRWTAPDCDISYYTLYVNGEAVGEISASDTEYTYPVEDDMYYIFRITATNGETESDKSERLEYNTIDKFEAAYNAPLAPQNVSLELVYLDKEKELLTANDNLIITWDPSKHDAAHYDADAYIVYVNGVASGVVTADNSVVENGKTVYKFAYTAHSPREYGVYIRPYALGEDSSIIYGERSKTVFITTNKIALETPVLRGDYDSTLGKIVLNWTEIEGADYYVVYNPNDPLEESGSTRKIYNTTITMPAEVNKDYEYIVVAVQDGTDIKSDKSNVFYQSTYDDVDIPADLPGAPKIVRSISDYESQVTIYWTPPEVNADDIYGYYIIRSGERVKDSSNKDVVVLASDMTMYGEYKYTFKVPEATTIPVMVVPFEKRNDMDFVGNASNVWNIRLELNVCTKTITDNPDLFFDVSRKDADGDGLVDEVGAMATLTGSINAGGAVATVAVKDARGNKLAVVTAKTNFQINVPMSLDASEKYTLEVSRTNYTTYRITGMDLNDENTRNRRYDNLRIYAGDVNANGLIDSDDLSIVNANYGTKGDRGDVDGNGEVGVDDLSYVNLNYDKRSVEYTITQYMAANP